MSFFFTCSPTHRYTDSMSQVRSSVGDYVVLADRGSPRVSRIRFTMDPHACGSPPSPDYVPGHEHPPSLDYVPGPEHLQPTLYMLMPHLPPCHQAMWQTLIRMRIRKRTPRRSDYPADGGDSDDEPYDDDDDDDDTDDEDADEEEEEHLAPTDSSTIPVTDLVPSARGIKAFETDESAPTPCSLRLGRIVSCAHTHHHHPPSPLLPWSSLLPQIPSPPLPPPPSLLHLPPPVPMSLPLPSSRITTIYKPHIIQPPFEGGGEFGYAPRPTRGHRADYGFIGTVDAEIRVRRIGRLSYFRELVDWSRIDSFTMRLHECWIRRPHFPRCWHIPLGIVVSDSRGGWEQVSGTSGCS
ncbi:hypothetical protein Tco_0968851 [Tanacetum coccineum]